MSKKNQSKERGWDLATKLRNIFCISGTYEVEEDEDGNVLVTSSKAGLYISFNEHDIQNMEWNSRYGFIWLYSGMEIIYHIYQDQLIIVNGGIK